MFCRYAGIKKENFIKWAIVGNFNSYVIGYDGEFDGVAWVQAVSAALNFGHMEEEFLALINLIIKEAKLTFDGIDNCSLLLTNGGDLNREFCF